MTATLPTTSTEPPLSAVHFTGRKTELDQIIGHLTSGGVRSPSVLLYGSGGIGKTGASSSLFL